MLFVLLAQASRPEFPGLNQPFDLSDYLTKIINTTQYTPADQYQLNEIQQQIEVQYNRLSKFLDSINVSAAVMCENNTVASPVPEYLNFAYYSDVQKALCQRFVTDQRNEIDFNAGIPLPKELYDPQSDEHFSELVLWQYDNIMYQWPYYPSNNSMFNQRVKKYLFVTNFTIYFQDGTNFLLSLMDSVSPLSHIRIICLQNDSLLYDGLVGNFQPEALLRDQSFDPVVNIDRAINAINSADNQHYIIMAKGIEYSIALKKQHNTIYFINTYMSAMDTYIVAGANQKHATRIRDAIVSIYQFARRAGIQVYCEDGKQYEVGADSIHNETDTIKRILQGILQNYALDTTIITPPIYTNDVLVKQYVNFVAKPLFDNGVFVGYVAASFRINEIVDSLCGRHPALLTADFLMFQNDYLFFFSGSQNRQNVEYFNYLRHIPRNQSYYELDLNVYNSTQQNYFFYEYRIARQIIHITDIYINNHPLQERIVKQHLLIKDDQQKYLYKKGRYLEVGYTKMNNLSLFTVAKGQIRMVLILSSVHYNDEEFNKSRFGIHQYSPKVLNMDCSEVGLPENCLQNAAERVQFNVPYQILTLQYANGSQVRYINYFPLLSQFHDSNCSMNNIIALDGDEIVCTIGATNLLLKISNSIRYVIKELLIFWTLAANNMHGDEQLEQAMFINMTHYRISLQYSQHFGFFIYDGNHPQALTNFQTIQIMQYINVKPYCTATSTQFQLFMTQLYINIPDINIYNLSYANLNNSFNYLIYNIMNRNQNYSMMAVSIKYSNYQQLMNFYKDRAKNFIVFNTFAKVIFTPAFQYSQQVFQLQRQSFLSQMVCQNSQVSIKLLQRLFAEESLQITFYVTASVFCLQFNVVNLSQAYELIPNTNIVILQLDWNELQEYIKLESLPCFGRLEDLNEYVRKHFWGTIKNINVNYNFTFGTGTSDNSSSVFNDQEQRIADSIMLLLLFAVFFLVLMPVFVE